MVPKYRRKEDFGMFTLIAAAVGVPLTQFAEGALLAASVYLVSRGAADVRRK